MTNRAAENTGEEIVAEQKQKPFAGLRNLYSLLLYVFFDPIWNSFLQPVCSLYIRKKYSRTLKKVRKKSKVKVAFMVIHDSVWKYDDVYRLMKNDKRFEPVVVVCPYVSYGEQTMLRDMEQAYATFSGRGYNVVKTYNTNTGNWLDVKKEINPDIIFFTNPHKLTRPEYYITNYLDRLTCYVPYAFVVIFLLDMHYNQPFQNLLWRAFYETPIHKKFAEQLAVNKGANVLVTGYPGIDKLIEKSYVSQDNWKVKDRNLKRIIWAPHHTIETDAAGLEYSCFLKYADFMLQTARKYSDKIQVAFKPHPLLRPKLNKPDVWGPDKTEKYYRSWDELPNGQLNESDYVDLFLTSDAMIHDSASFMVEYLYTGKPVAFTLRDERITERFNDFGKEVFEYLYHVTNETGMEEFLNNVVLGGQDNMKQSRMQFVQNILMPPYGKTASENIYEHIVKEVFSQNE